MVICIVITARALRFAAMLTLVDRSKIATVLAYYFLDPHLKYLSPVLFTRSDRQCSAGRGGLIAGQFLDRNPQPFSERIEGPLYVVCALVLRHFVERDAVVILDDLA